MSFTIDSLSALEILDSRSRPTISVTLRLADGSVGNAQVPSGASTGSREAVELRDGDKSRFNGLGTLKAVGNVEGPIASAVAHRSFESLEELDKTLIELDGTPNKGKLGANAILGTSMAFARAAAASEGAELFEWHVLKHFAARDHIELLALQTLG